MEPMARRERSFLGRHRGSALLLVLFAIILLTALVTGTVGMVKNDIDEYGALSKAFRARQIAESGLAFGINPLVQNQDRALLEQKMPDGGQFDVLISSESTKINVNYLLANGRGDLLSNLFVGWGIPAKTADAAVEGLKKYLSNPVDNRLASTGGQPAAASTQPAAASTQAAAASTQPTSPTTQAPEIATVFGSVAEMSLVPEFGPVMTKRPDWSDFFTIWGDGKIDVNLADASTIALIAGVSSSTADQFVKYRWGPDGKPFTLDDRIYTDMEAVRVSLGMSAEQFQLVQDLLSLTSAVDRIESKGTIAGYTKEIVVVTNRNMVPITYLSWQEK